MGSRWALVGHGVVSAAATGAQIDVNVRLPWPLPFIFLCWVGVYASGLRYRSFGTDDLLILPMALFFWGSCAYFVVAMARGSIQELRRITMAQPESASWRM